MFNSDLAVSVYIDGKNDCSLMLFEYLQSPTTFYNDTVYFSIKDGTGDKSSFFVKTPKRSTKYLHCNELIPLLKKGGTLKLVVTEDTSSYKFTIDASNFNELYTKYFEK